MTSFTRSKLTGIETRLRKMYQGCLFGLRMELAYKAHFGMRDQILSASLAEGERLGCAPMQSRHKYEPRTFTYAQRLELERHARVMRGERLDSLMRRQA